MFACICNAVTDEQVSAAVKRGATSVEDVGSETEAGTGCGCCWDHIEDLIAEACRECPLSRQVA